MRRLRSGFEKHCTSLKKKATRIDVIHLGEIAEQRCDFADAEKLYRKALEIAKQNGKSEYEAHSYQHLGLLACQQCDYEASKKWYEKALENHEKRGVTD